MYYSNKYDENTINYILNSLDKSSYTISKELNIPASTIRKIRKQNNVDMSTKQTKIPNDLIDIIYQEVMQGKSFAELGKKYNIDRKLISKKLEEIYNFKKKRKRFTEEEKRIIYEEAKNNLNSDLAKKYNCHETTIQRIYKKYANTNEDKIYNYEKYFDNIDSYDKAYWLGFIAADRCLYEDQDKYYSLIISLQEQDKYILEKFYLCINKTIRNNIYETIQNDRKYYSIKIGSRYMGKSLLKLNITPRKHGYINQYH